MGMASVCVPSPKPPECSCQEQGFHGCHMECLHGLLASGRLQPNTPELAGTRSVEGRGGVYLHRLSNRRLAETDASLTRFGTRHVFAKPCLELQFDNMGSVKAGKCTNPCVWAFNSVQMTAVRIKIATRRDVEQGKYLRKWALKATLAALRAMKLDWALPGHEPENLTTQVARVEILPRMCR